MTFLRIENVSKIYNGRRVLDKVSFEVSKGEIYSIAGPPGSGKTTLLKIIAGLIHPDEGRIYIGGQDVTDEPPSKRDVGMVFETPPVYPDRTGFDNIAFPLRLMKVPKNEIRRRVMEIAELLGISHLLDRKPDTYSGGEYQRVALARALIRSPRILLLDEPFRNLDAKIQESMRSWLKKLQREIGITMIYVTHDPIEAMWVGDKIGIILRGSMLQQGPPSTIYFNPSSLEVLEYVSVPAINVIDGKIYYEGGLWKFKAGNVEILRAKGRIEGLEEGERRVKLAVRPQDVLLSKYEGEKHLKGRVVLIQYFGSGKLASIEIDDLLLRSYLLKDFEASEGEEVYVTLREDGIYIFDAESGERLRLFRE